MDAPRPPKDDVPASLPIKRIDINSIFPIPTNHNTKISIDPVETDEDARHRRQKDTWLFRFELIFLGVILAGLGGAIFLGSPDDKRWAMALVAAIAGALARHFFGGGKG